MVVHYQIVLRQAQGERVWLTKGICDSAAFFAKRLEAVSIKLYYASPPLMVSPSTQFTLNEAEGSGQACRTTAAEVKPFLTVGPSRLNHRSLPVAEPAMNSATSSRPCSFSLSSNSSAVVVPICLARCSACRSFNA